MDIDVAQIVTAYKEQEQELMRRMEPEERAKYLERRVIDSEATLAQVLVNQAKASILTKYTAVEEDDLAEAKTVQEAEKMAARIQAKADKLAAKFQTEMDEKLQGGLSAEDWDKVKKATGRPRQVNDETQNQVTDAEQKAGIQTGLEAEKPINFGDMKAVEEAARRAGRRGLEVVLGPGVSQNG